MTDGGSENRNSLIRGFLDEKDISVKQMIAGKDIDFSNSMVEAVNKKIQPGYLSFFFRAMLNAKIKQEISLLLIFRRFNFSEVQILLVIPLYF